jgi:cytochrome c oxidase subunit II
MNAAGEARFLSGHLGEYSAMRLALISTTTSTRALGLAALPSLASAAPPSSAVHPAGEMAAAIAQSWWIMFWGAVVIFVVVMALALYAMFRRTDKRPQVGGSLFIIGGGVVFPVVTLTALLIYGVGLGREITRPLPVAVEIEVIGSQFWWEVRYPREGIVTANEIHIPAGERVGVRVRTRDVIHSFAVPSLAGRIDLIPGQPNQLRLHAFAPGLFRGQCAEFCGDQHARMAFLVEAMEPQAYAQWVARQREPARPPATELLRRGHDRFFEQGCNECHTIRGTAANGLIGPDLTHIGTRRTLGAGTIDNNVENMVRWIRENQRIKPAVRMPQFDRLSIEEAREIALYLSSLK